MKKQSSSVVLTIAISILILSACSATDRNTKQAFEAVNARNWAKVTELVGKGVEIDAMSETGYTLLHLSNDPALTALLIEKGHNVNLQSGGLFSEKEKKSFLAGRRVNQNVSEKMKNSLSHIDENDPYLGEKLSPLHIVNNPEAIKLLIEAGANPNSISLYGITPIGEVRSLDSLQHLLSAGASLGREGYHASPLEIFLRNNSINEFDGGKESYFRSIQLFVENGVDLKAKNNGDSNVLHAANYKVTPDILTYLLKSGADPKLDDGNWGGAFCLAIKESQNDLVLAYAAHDFTLLYHKCDGGRLASVYAKEEAKFKSTHHNLVKMERIVKEQLQKK